jgi:tetratricopeptide (TPR) repeat protein
MLKTGYSLRQALVSLILAAWVGVCYGQPYAAIYLKNGDRITGSDLQVDKGVVRIRAHDARLQIPMDDVQSIVPLADLSQIPNAAAEKHFQNAKALLELGLREKAKAQLMAAVEEFPRYAEAYYELGRLFQEDGDNDEALKYLGYAATINPKAYSMAPQFKQAGDAYLAAEEYRQAVDAYLFLFRNYPNHEDAAFAAYTAGFLMAEQLEDATGEALKTLQEALARYPNSPHREKATYLAGALQSKTGQADAAIETLTNFILTYPQSQWLAQAYLARGDAYLQLRQNRDATVDFTQAYEKTTDARVRQEAERKRDESAWTVYTVSDGLPSNHIQAIAVDGQTLWIGTPKGLAQVDVSMESWRVASKVTGYINALFDESEPINVRALAVDDKELWIGTLNHGVIQYNKQADLPENHDHRSGLPHKTVYDIKMDKDDVWVGTFSGAARFLRSTRQWLTYNARNDRLPADKIAALAITPTTVWIGTSANGMAVYDRQADDWRTFGAYDNLELKPGSAIVSFDVSGETVFFTWYYQNQANGYGVIRPDPFNRYDTQLEQVIVGTPPIFPVENIYIAAGKPSEKEGYFPSEGSLPTERVAEAPAANPAAETPPMWIATNDGLYVYVNGWTRVGFPTDRLGAPTVNCIALGDNVVWVGTSSGLAKIDTDTLASQDE